MFKKKMASLVGTIVSVASIMVAIVEPASLFLLTGASLLNVVKNTDSDTILNGVIEGAALALGQGENKKQPRRNLGV